MSVSIVELMAMLHSLDPEERRDTVVKLLRERGGSSDTPVSDDQLVALADQLCEALDLEDSENEA
jgi:hypothetical protein